MKACSLFTAAALMLVGLAQAPLANAGHARQTTRPTPRAMFAGLDNGSVYQSTDGGLTWKESDNGLASGQIYPLQAGAGATIYAAPGDSGVYISYDAGQSWLDDNGVHGPSGKPIFGLAVDPGDGERVYALDNRGNFYRSSDSGGHWSATPAPLTKFQNSTANALQLDPLRPATLLISSDEGMSISTDTGITWANVDSIPSGTDVYEAAFSGANPDVAYAATSQGIYQTIDGGTTWQQEKQGIPDGTALVVVAVDPNNASVVIANSAGGLIYRSTDGGSTWRQVTDTGGSNIKALAFDAGHAGTVMAGTTDGSALYISTDDGVTWQQTDPGFGSDTAVVSLASAVRAPLPTDTVLAPPAGTSGIYYAKATHHSITGAFLQYFNANSGLRLFGLPLTEVFTEHGYPTQYFERAAMVYAGGKIHLAPLGSRLTAARQFTPGKRAATTATFMYFSATRHTLSGRFLTFWRAHHGAATIGMPISEPVREANGDGTHRVYLVQYFQNLRLEYHPELSGTSYEISVGQLGRQALQNRGWL